LGRDSRLLPHSSCLKDRAARVGRALAPRHMELDKGDNIEGA